MENNTLITIKNLKNMSLYKINEKTATASNLSTFITAGIHEDVTLVDIKVAVSERGNPFLAFYFENANGDKLSHTEWPARPKKPIEAMSLEEKEIFLKYSIERPMERLKQIIEVFGLHPNFEADSFTDLANYVVKLLGDTYKGKLLRVKVLYDDKGFTTLPKNSSNTFIESMGIPTTESKIRILPSDEKYLVRNIKGDVEKTENNPFESPTTETSEDKVSF